jgi:hypothetical protein
VVAPTGRGYSNSQGAVMLYRGGFCLSTSDTREVSKRFRHNTADTVIVTPRKIYRSANRRTARGSNVDLHFDMPMDLRKRDRDVPSTDYLPELEAGAAAFGRAIYIEDRYMP